MTTPYAYVEASRRLFAEDWPDIGSRIADVQRRSLRAPRVVVFLSHALYDGVLAAGSRIGSDLTGLRAPLQTAIDAVVVAAATGPLPRSDLEVFAVYAAFAATGGQVDGGWGAALAGALPAVPVAPRDDARVVDRWNLALAALALDVPFIYRPIAGYEMGQPVPFRPGATFQFDVQGLLGHLAGALENAAPLADCMPAFEDLLASFVPLRKAGSLDLASLLWVAWVMHHRIGGGAVGGVADFLHEHAFRAAGLPSAGT